MTDHHGKDMQRNWTCQKWVEFGAEEKISLLYIATCGCLAPPNKKYKKREPQNTQSLLSSKGFQVTDGNYVVGVGCPTALGPRTCSSSCQRMTRSKGSLHWRVNLTSISPGENHTLILIYFPHQIVTIRSASLILSLPLAHFHLTLELFSGQRNHAPGIGLLVVLC